VIWDSATKPNSDPAAMLAVPVPCAVLETAHVGGSDGRDTTVRLVVFGLPDGLPFCSLGHIGDDEFGEAVCKEVSGGERDGMKKRRTVRLSGGG
jgi:hypothetical protein